MLDTYHIVWRQRAIKHKVVTLESNAINKTGLLRVTLFFPEVD